MIKLITLVYAAVMPNTPINAIRLIPNVAIIGDTGLFIVTDQDTMNVILDAYDSSLKFGVVSKEAYIAYEEQLSKLDF